MDKICNIDTEIQKAKESYGSLKNLPDHILFTIVCLKAFYFPDNDDYNYESMANYITDESNDGGVDAIINDTNGDVIIVQSKYYSNTTLSKDIIIADLQKICETVNKLENNKVQDINAKVKSKFFEAKDEMDESGEVKIAFFTKYDPRVQTKARISEAINSMNLDFTVEVHYYKEIETQIEVANDNSILVKSATLELDRPNNVLEYENSAIVNISAKSLQNLYSEKSTALLGVNLRYYIKNKTVDEGIKDTIKNHPELFWYCNNGIIIICDDYDIYHGHINLNNFSIINGGQTTHNIGNIDIDEDFYITCKVVKAQGNTLEEKLSFSQKIAKASNAQKPIKEADLIANSPEQIALSKVLINKKIVYQTKRGEVIKKEFKKLPYIKCSIEDYGKVALAAIYLMPGSARSKKNDMYDEKRKAIIFNSEISPGIVADGLVIDYLYNDFKKNLTKQLKNNYNKPKEDIINLSENEWEMAKNASRLVVSALAFLCKYKNKDITKTDIEKNQDNLLPILSPINNTKKLLRTTSTENFEQNQEILIRLFYKLIRLISKLCTKIQPVITPANFAKNNKYFNNILLDIIEKYEDDDSFREDFNKVMSVKQK